MAASTSTTVGFPGTFGWRAGRSRRSSIFLLFMGRMNEGAILRAVTVVPGELDTVVSELRHMGEHGFQIRLGQAADQVKLNRKRAAGSAPQRHGGRQYGNGDPSEAASGDLHWCTSPWNSVTVTEPEKAVSGVTSNRYSGPFVDRAAVEFLLGVGRRRAFGAREKSLASAEATNCLLPI